MTYVILFIIVSALTGFLVTYFIDSKSASHNLQFSIFERLTYGVVIGLGLSTWIVYLFSLFFGLQFACIYIAMFLQVTFCFLFLIIKWNSLKVQILHEIAEIKNDCLRNRLSYFLHTVIFVFFTAIFWRLFSRTIIWKNDGMYVGLLNNWGDLPLHLAYITSFVWGDNIPAEDPTFAGVKLVYPILSDFLSAIFLKLGAGFKEILFIPGFILTTVLYGTLYYFTFRLTKRRLAAIVSIFVFFFSGGFGFYYFFQDIANSPNGIWWFLTHLTRDYTKIISLNYHWITPLTCLNVPQRPFLFGFPITIIVFSLLYMGIGSRWQLAIGKRQKAKGRKQLAGNACPELPTANGQLQTDKRDAGRWRLFLFAGIVAGSLPFFHTHSFLAMLMVTIPLAIIFWDWRKWFLFFCPAFLLSLPQVLSFFGHVGGGSFFKYNFGWLAGNENVLWFWVKNTGLFWFVYVGGLVPFFIFKMGLWFRVQGSGLESKEPAMECKAESSKVKGVLQQVTNNEQPAQVNQLAVGNKDQSGTRNPEHGTLLIYFSLPFLILFILPNVMLFAPWDWDNIKILVYWFLGSVPLVSLTLSRLYEVGRYKIILKTTFFIIIFFLTISGGIDVFRYAVAPINGWKEFSNEEMELAKRISANTEPDAVFLNAPVHNHLVFLSGRKSLMGFPGHIWSHGYKGSSDRERDVRKMLKGQNGLKIVDGRKERISLIDTYRPDYAIIGPHERRIGVNEKHFATHYECVMTSDNYHVYDLKRKLEYE